MAAPINPACGEDHPSAKLTEAQAREVYHLAHGGSLSLRKIAQQYGVTKGAVQWIKERRNWAWLWKEEEEQT